MNRSASVIGIDLGGTNTRVGLLDEAGGIRFGRRFETRSYRTRDAAGRLRRLRVSIYGRQQRLRE